MEKISTGLAGLDEILFGGLIPQKAYLLQGGSDSGKSTFGLSFCKSSCTERGEILVHYLADNILFLRYLEVNGHLRKSIGVLKKRLSDFEKSIREFEIISDGIKVGAPLKNMRDILTGLPEGYH